MDLRRNMQWIAAHTMAVSSRIHCVLRWALHSHCIRYATHRVNPTPTWMSLLLSRAHHIQMCARPGGTKYLTIFWFPFSRHFKMKNMKNALRRALTPTHCIFGAGSLHPHLTSYAHMRLRTSVRWILNRVSGFSVQCVYISIDYTFHHFDLFLYKLAVCCLLHLTAHHE